MPFDYKKEYKEFYLPPQKPQLLEVPPMNYVAVRGHGDPNAQDGEYQAAIGMLYAVAFTIKMSYKGTHQIPGYFEYVVPPLEGLWWQEGQSRVDYAHKETFSWIAMIRLQCMHLGNYDTEPATLNAMEQFAAERHYKIDCTSARLHHEIYLSDPRRTAPEKCKTVIREPVCKVE